MITDAEKEKLFEEFKILMLKETSVAYLRKTNFKPARSHFDKKYKEYRLLYKAKHEKCSINVWPLISTIMARGSDAEYIQKIKPEVLPLANEYGKKFVDLYFEFLIKVRQLNAEGASICPQSHECNDS